MGLDRRCAGLSVLAFLAVLTFGTAPAAGQATIGPARRVVTVADSIEMSRLPESEDPLGISSHGNVAKVSPSGKRFVIVIKKGNLKNNTNDYSLLLFETASMLRIPRPAIVLTMASSSNRPAMQNLKWLPDDETVAFMGERPGELPQVYAFNVRTKRLKKVTDHATPIIRYDISNNGEVIVFEAEPPITKRVDTAETRRNGLVVSNQNLLDILTGDRYPPFNTEGEQLFLQIQGRPVIQITVEDYIDHGMLLSLSPDGKYAVVQVFARHFPQAWKEYSDPVVSGRATERRPKGSWVALFRYMLLDTKTAELTPLLNTPSIWRNRISWSPDGKSVVLCAARLPLDVEDRSELDRRAKNVYVIEVRVPGKEVLTIKQDAERYAWFQPKWNGSNRIFLMNGSASDNPAPAAYERDGSKWREVPVIPEDSRSGAPLDVVLDEDMNTPPKIRVFDPQSKQKKLLLDPNPQFEDLDFGKVEKVTWRGVDGHEFWGGLFWPLDYAPGKSYPLVIQTHGFNPGVFSMDGLYNPGSAARPLAGKGFVVLQVNGPMDPGYGEGTREAPVQMAGFEGAIDWLANRGLIDRSRVGLVGFSRTVYYVAYTLTHSKYHFAAAIMVDGINAGYFQYISQGGSSMSLGDLLNGGLPYGETAASWIQNSPGFNLDKVQTPVRLETHAYGGGDAPSEWEWYVGLSHLNKPVELIYLPDADHILVKPWERMVSQQGAVDWFSFWLKDEEDSDPAKYTQYERWRELRLTSGADRVLTLRPP